MGQRLKRRDRVINQQQPILQLARRIAIHSVGARDRGNRSFAKRVLYVLMSVGKRRR